MHRLLARLNAARRMPAGLVAAKLLRRAGLAGATAARWEVLADPRSGNVERLPRLFLDSVARAAEGAGWAPFGIEGADILEVGCGRLGGLGPYFVARGAHYFAGIDPGFDPSLFTHPRIVDRCVAPALEAARHLPGAERDVAGRDAAGREVAGPVDLPAFFDRSGYFRGGLTGFPASNAARRVTGADRRLDDPLTLARPDPAGRPSDPLAALAKVLSPDARQLHLVNFSNHLDKAAPFRHLYDLTPDQHRARYGPHINFLRAPDMLEAFRSAGYAATLLPLDVLPEAVSAANISAWWRERYSLDDLMIRTALILV